MKPMTFILNAALCLYAVFGESLSAQTAIIHEHVTGLRGPLKLVALDSGVVLVAEGGNGPNTGRVSVIDRDRRLFTLIDGIPSAMFMNRDPSGASGLLLLGKRLYIVIGGGNVTVAGPVPMSEVPNPNPASPLFNSVLLLEFLSEGNDLPLGFYFPPEWHGRVAGGEGVYLHNADGVAARLSRVADLPDYSPQPRPDVPNAVRQSNPFGIVGNDSRLDVVDASGESIWSLTAPDFTPRILYRFSPVPNTLSTGPPMVDAVPSTIRAYGDSLLVSQLTGFPFGAGAAGIFLVDRHQGTAQQIVGGLQTAVDVLPVTRGPGLFWVLEYSTSFTTNAPGRLLRIDDIGRTPLVLATGLINPTSMAVDPGTGDLLVSEISQNRVVRVQIP